MGFSESELGVVRCLLAGLSDSEIAAREGLEPRAVAHQIERVMQELGLRHRIELMFYAATKEGQEVFGVAHARNRNETPWDEPRRKTG